MFPGGGAGWAQGPQGGLAGPGTGCEGPGLRSLVARGGAGSAAAGAARRQGPPRGRGRQPRAAGGRGVGCGRAGRGPAARSHWTSLMNVLFTIDSKMASTSVRPGCSSASGASGALASSGSSGSSRRPRPPRPRRRPDKSGTLPAAHACSLLPQPAAPQRERNAAPHRAAPLSVRGAHLRSPVRPGVASRHAAWCPRFFQGRGGGVE